MIENLMGPLILEWFVECLLKLTFYCNCHNKMINNDINNLMGIF
jgi:hypothetical protein